MKLRHICTLVLSSLLSAKAATAQAGIYALFTGADLDTSSTVISSPITSPSTFTSNTTTTMIYGPTFGLYADFPTPVVKFGGDVRGSLLNGGGSHLYYGVTGPRLEVDVPFLNLKPYGEALIGGGQYFTKADTNAALRFNYVLLAGVDRKLNALLEWRVLEFSYTKVIIETDTPVKALSTGLVLRIP
jgi:hypothetical protein